MPQLWALEPAYPRPRKRDAAGAAGAGGLAALAPPQVTLWPFFIQENGLRGTVVSPPMAGPAIVDRWVWGGTQNATANLIQASLLYSTDNGGQGSNQALTPLPSGTLLFTTPSSTADAAVTSGPDAGLWFPGVANVTQHFEYRIGAYIPLNTFHLKVTFKQPAAVGMNLYGHVRVLEGIDPELLLDYLA